MTAILLDRTGLILRYEYEHGAEVRRIQFEDKGRLRQFAFDGIQDDQATFQETLEPDALIYALKADPRGDEAAIAIEWLRKRGYATRLADERCTRCNVNLLEHHIMALCVGCRQGAL